MPSAAWVVVVGIVAASPPARANPDGQPAVSALRWVHAPGAESCITVDQLAAAVEHRLGRRVFASAGAASADLVIDGAIAPVAPAGWRATIVVKDGAGSDVGERTLDDPDADCRAIDGKLELVVALIIDPTALSRRAVEPPVDVSAPSPGPAAPTARWRWSIAGAALGAGGLLPGAALGAQLAAEVDPPRLWPIELSVAGWAEDRVSDAAGGSTFSLVNAGLALCPTVVERGRFSLDACAGGQLGRLRVRGFDFAPNRTAASTLGHATAELRVRARLGTMWSAVAGVGSWIALVRPRVVYDSGTETMLLYQPPPASVVVRLGLAVRF